MWAVAGRFGPVLNSDFIENRPSGTWGADQRNLAAMVNNPTDLVQPRGETPPYAPRRSVVLERYPKGESPSGAYAGYESQNQ